MSIKVSWSVMNSKYAGRWALDISVGDDNKNQ